MLVRIKLRWSGYVGTHVVVDRRSPPFPSPLKGLEPHRRSFDDWGNLACRVGRREPQLLCRGRLAATDIGSDTSGQVSGEHS